MKNNRLAFELRPACSMIVLLMCGVLGCADAMAVQPLPANTLPVPAGNWQGAAIDTNTSTANHLTINQTVQKAILNWQSFNIAHGSSVNFVQPGASAIALNRINDQNPSIIQGALTANGQVYLINHNGILFDNGAQVNVHTLVASTLDISDDIFNRGIGAVTDGSPVFAGGTVPDGLVRVEAGAQLASLTGGKIMLFAPNVENNGVINTPDGQIILAAGSKVYLAPTPGTDPGLRGLLVEVDNGGNATNLGQILAQRGNITLMGLAVNQRGRVSATTSVNANGSIRLLARDTTQPVPDGSGNQTVTPTNTGAVTFGAGSVTEVTPELSDSTTSPDEQQFNPSRVEVMGGNIQMQSGSRIVAPGGQVTLTALDNPSNPQLSIQGSASNASRIYLDSGSIIDVSGTQDVSVPIERNLVKVDLYGDVLKDSPLVQQSFLRGKTITVDISKGTPLGDYSGYEAKIGRTVAERTAAGGTVKLASEGDIVVRQDATVNLSGGSLHYQDGYLNTTKLVSQGKIYDISEARPDMVFDGFAGSVSRTHEKWGVTETWESPLVAASRGQFTQGYVEGKNAGTLQFVAPSLVMEGTVIGKTIAGIYQRQPYATDLANAPYKTLHTLLPNGATLIAGDAAQATEANPDFRMSSVNFVAQSAPLPEGFDASTALPADRADQAQLATGLMGKDAVANLAVYSNGKISLPSGLTLEAPGGSVTLAGREVDVAGNIDVQSGNITLKSQGVYNQVGGVNTVAVSGTLNASGGWVNDYAPIHDASAGFDPLLIKGGNITIEALQDALLAGSTLDVSGGGHSDSNGKLAGNTDAGSISISSGVGLSSLEPNATTLTLGNLYGYATGKGGSLSLATGKVRVGNNGQPGELVLPAVFFSQGGFSSYAVRGTDSLRVVAGQKIQAKAEDIAITSQYRALPTARSMSALTRRELLPDGIRRPSSLTFSANYNPDKSKNNRYGELTVENGAEISAGPGGSISLTAGRQMTVNGVVSAPAGSIALTMYGEPISDDSLGFYPDQSIWLGQHAQLLSTGYDQTLVSDNGLHRGEILNGGKISITANKGYVVTEAGSVMDVSGISGAVDVLEGNGHTAGYQHRQIASDAGAIQIDTREGALLDGSVLGQAGGAGAQGGSFSLNVFRSEGISPLPPVSTGLPYPAADRQVVVSQASGFIAAGLQPGDTIADGLNGKGKVAADSLMNGGFGQVKLQAKDAVRFDGDVSLQTVRSIQLDAPTIAADSGKTVKLQSSYAGIANTDQRYQALPVVQGGSAKLDISAQWIDLTGKVALNGFGQTVLTSSGDIRLRGVWNQDATHLALPGALTSGGDLQLAARQIYPSTLSDFTLAISSNPSATLRILANGSDSPVLSAGGKLTLSAPNIVQDGVVKAPLGNITLSADNSLALGAGSITSVSAEGQIIPFGMTSNGKDWLYALDGSTNLSVTAPPQKRVTLNGNDVSIQNGAKVDLSGGGDLYAYEFIPGPPGRSVDVLDASYSSNSYAVLPGLSGAFAPYDTQYSAGSSLKPGDSIYLSGADGLPAGVYPLLPARYALLPGAFLVRTVNGYRDMQPQQKVNLADGTQIVAGYRTITQQLDDAARFSGFAVRPGADIKQEAEYQQSYASQFFARQAQANGTALPRLPVDAGQLVLAPRNTLSIQGDPLQAVHDGGHGAIVDVDANNLYIGDGSAGPSGYVSIDASTLSHLNAESVLLGGTRQTLADGTGINVDSGNIVVANSTANPLQAPEIILAAKDRITVNAGSDIEGSGSGGTAQDLIVGRGGNGDGALLRVAAGDHVEVTRENVQRAAGTLDIGSNALLKGKSITLDATLNTTSHADMQLAGGSLSLGAGRISLGGISGVNSGLALSNSELAALGSLDSLYLKSYSTIDFYGDLALGTGQSGIQHLALDTGGLRGFGNASKTVTLAAGDITLHNSGSANSDTAAASGSILNLQGQHVITLAEGSQHISGFGSTNLVSGGDITGHGAGTLQVDGGFNLQAARVTADSASDQKWAASGKVQISPSANTPAQAAPIGGRLAISGQRVLNQGNIELAAGIVSLTATGNGADDNVTLAAGSKTSTAGVAKPFGGVDVFAPGGQVKLTSSNGNVDIQAGATVDVSGAAGGGDAGSIQASAVNGQVTLAGQLKGGAASGAHQGSYVQDAKTLASFSALNAALEAGNFNEQRDVRVRQGDVSIAATDAVRAHTFSLAADAGKVDISGLVDASSDKGGHIAVAARDNVTLHSGSSLRANGATGKGGQVELSTTSGTLTAENGAQISVGGISGDVTADGGQVVLRAQRTAGNDVAINLGSGVISGARETIAEAVKVYNKITSIGTTTGSGKLNINTVKTDVTNFMANAATVEARLGNNAQLRAGIEVQSDGDLSLANDWDLSSWRFGGRTVMLTLRAAGDLNLNSNLSDGFNSALPTGTLGSGASAWYRLVSGADRGAANPLANQSLDTLAGGKGNLAVAAGKLVRTGTGSIAIAAGRDLTLGSDSSVVYTAGEKADSITDFIAPKYTIKVNNVSKTFDAQYAKNGGNLTLAAQGDINGAVTGQLITEWLHRQGNANTDGSFKTNTSWWLRFDQFKQGVGALGGGDVKIAAGGNISNLDAVVPTTGRVGMHRETVPVLDKDGNPAFDAYSNPITTIVKTILPPTVLGGGDLSVKAGGDIRSGVYYVARGHGDLSAGGGIVSGHVNSDGTPIHTVLALADGDFKLTTNHDLQLEAIMNPTVFAQGASQGIKSIGTTALQKSYFFTYTPDSKVELVSLSGDVKLADNTGLRNMLSKANTGATDYLKLFDDSKKSLYIYPPSLMAAALQGDVQAESQFTLFPSANGNLELLAANNVTVSGRINLSDADPQLLPGILNPRASYQSDGVGLNDKLLDKLYSAQYGGHAAVPVHAGDTVPVRIVAQTGDLAVTPNGELLFAKPAQVSAGRDVVDLNLRAQNLADGDVTSIRAGRDITYIDPHDANGKLQSNSRTVELDGPGRLELSAGRNIDLGNSAGVLTKGNLNNPALPDKGADITVLAGMPDSPDYSGFSGKYAGYQDAGSVAAWQKAHPNEDVPDGVKAATYGIGGATGYSSNLAYAFFDQLKLAGDEHNAGKDGAKDDAGHVMGYQRGYDAIAALFPGNRYKGDLNLFFSQIETFRGGNIDLFVPGGKINAGLASIPSDLISTKTDLGTTLASKLGIVTLKGGSVRSVSQGDFLVNSSRVMTLYGDNILLWSSEGNIDAGKGAKTALSLPPPVIKTDPATGVTTQEFQGAATGSGIRAMITGGNKKPDDVSVDLIAPKGTVNAGDAGIGSVGNINIAAQFVRGADNIQANGVATGVPVADTGSLAAGLTGVSGTAADAGKSGADAAQALAQQKPQDSFKPAYLNVEVIGFGD